MGSEIIEYKSATPMLALLDRIAMDSEPWSVAAVKRNYLRTTTDEAFTSSIRSFMQSTEETYVFFVNERRTYVVWRGKQKAAFRNLRSFISSVMMQPGLTIEPSVLVSFIDPIASVEDLKDILKNEKPEQRVTIQDEFSSEIPDEEDTEDMASGSDADLKPTPEQRDIYQESKSQKPYRRQLHMLVVEDQVFSQKLLCEILRAVRVRNNNDSPVIDVVQSVQEAWKIFLKRAPDIVFVDLGLIDGSGHTLARAIKEMDPQTYVVIVTANNYEEELNIARQNNVDNFIAKPYNKKQILDCVEKYVGVSKPQLKGASRG